MPVKTKQDDGVTTISVTSGASGPSMSVTMHPAEGYDGALMRVEVTQTRQNIMEALGVKGEATSHYARNNLTQYEVPKDQTEAVLKKLGLPEGLGGRSGVKITFTQDSANKGESHIRIEAKDPKAPGFNEAHAGDVMRKLASTKDALPDNIKATIIKDNPGMAANVLLESSDRGGTRIQFKPVDAGNLPFSMSHDAKTGADVLHFKIPDSPDQVKELNLRITQHLKANGINTANSNVGNILSAMEHNSVMEHKENISRVQLGHGSVRIELPPGSGERALSALSKPAEFKVGNVTYSSKPIVSPEIASAATPELAASVRPVAHTEHEAKVATQKSNARPVSFGNILAKLGFAAATATGAGIAAAAQAPEGERLEAGTKAAGKALAENALPGVTETDTCKKVGAAVGMAGGALGAAAGVAVATGGTIIAAPVTVGGSVVVSPVTVTAAGFWGGGIGQQTGELLGEGVCKLAKAASEAISKENMAYVVHKPTEQTVASTKIPDSAGAKPATAVAAERS